MTDTIKPNSQNSDCDSAQSGNHVKTLVSCKLFSYKSSEFHKNMIMRVSIKNYINVDYKLFQPPKYCVDRDIV